MNISNNIKSITKEFDNWSFYTNKSYTAKIQKADPDHIYNVHEQPGIVYNFLEDSYERVGNTGYVVTGLAGEMWPIGESSLKKYNVNKADISLEPVSADTIELDTVYAAARIICTLEFTLEADYGEKAILKGNSPGIEHADGDYILVKAKMKDGEYIPDFEDSGRIINGSLFTRLYKPFLL